MVVTCVVSLIMSCRRNHSVVILALWVISVIIDCKISSSSGTTAAATVFFVHVHMTSRQVSGHRTCACVNTPTVEKFMVSDAMISVSILTKHEMSTRTHVHFEG